MSTLSRRKKDEVLTASIPYPVEGMIAAVKKSGVVSQIRLMRREANLTLDILSGQPSKRDYEIDASIVAWTSMSYETTIVVRLDGTDLDRDDRA